MLRPLSLLAAVTTLAVLPWQHRHPTPLTPSFAATFSSDTTASPGPAASFTRATASTKCVDGTVSSVSSGSAVIGQPIASGGTCSGAKGVYVGAATTSYALNNEDFSAASWLGGSKPTITVDAIAAPDGNVTADKLDDESGSALYVYENISVANNTATYTASVWVKCGAAQTATLGIQLILGTEVDSFNYFSCTTSWARYTVSATNNGSGNTSLHLFVAPTDSRSGAATGYAYVWRPEVYASSFPKPLDPAVAGSAVVVNADALTYGSSAPGDTGTITGWINIPAAAGNIAVWDGTKDLAFYFTSAGQLAFKTASLADNALTYSASSAIPANTWTFVAVAFDQASADVRLYADGSEVSYVGTDRSWTAGGDFGSTMTVGGTYGSTSASLFAGNLRRYVKDLSAAQILAIRNSQSGSYALAPRNPMRRWLYAAVGPEIGSYLAREIGIDDGSVMAGARLRVATDPELIPAWSQEATR